MTDIVNELLGRHIPSDDSRHGTIYKRAADEIERLRESIKESLHELCDPCDACDFGDSEFLALRATVDNAIGKLRNAVIEKQSLRSDAATAGGGMMDEFGLKTFNPEPVAGALVFVTIEGEVSIGQATHDVIKASGYEIRKVEKITD